MFGRFVKACGSGGAIGDASAIQAIATGARLLKTMLASISSVQGSTGDVLWQSVGKGMSLECLRALSSLRAQIHSDNGKLDDETKRAVCGGMASVVGALASLFEACRRQIGTDAVRFAGETVDIILDVARTEGNVRLGRAALNLIRDQLASGASQLLSPGIELSVQTLEQEAEQDVAVAAVGVITESLKGHWQEFWPADVVCKSLTAPGSDGFVAADVAHQQLYSQSIQGLVQAVRSADLSICRAGLLALQTLDAARRLYMRQAAFRNTAAAEAIMVECVRILGAYGDEGRESLGEESVQVVWGIAKVDLYMFYKVGVPGLIEKLGGVSQTQK